MQQFVDEPEEAQETVQENILQWFCRTVMMASLKCHFLLQPNKAALTGGKHVLFHFGQFPGIFVDLDLGLGSGQRIVRVEKMT